jgi:hypothetical protein
VITGTTSFTVLGANKEMNTEIEGIKFIPFILGFAGEEFVSGVRIVTKRADATHWTSNIIRTMGDFGREIERLKVGVDLPTETDFLH